jgi:DNA polymerase
LNTPDKIKQALLAQKEIFGDYLFQKGQNIKPSETKSIPISEKIIKKEESILFKDEGEAFQNAKTLDELNKLICNCLKCSLGKTRNKFVFGVGNPNADAMFIGEGPGADEDAQGEPFVGRAGKLLNEILKAINFRREEVYIANIIKCRPPNNRTPLQSEMDMCLPYLEKQIELIKPKIIMCLGATAASGLLGKKESLGSMRQKVFDYNGIKTMVTYHPAALLRNPQWKRTCWEDVKMFRKLYDELTA